MQYLQKFSLVITTAAFITIAGTVSALANSCTTQAQECKIWASSQGAQASTYAAACTREISACINRCKGGKKFFLGVSKGAGGGQQYPVDECK
ncbi:hypothetical protein JQ596_25355 [Bradyrhizobium manausense]|uniref:hypothetical protein n=1 Tax=Bradyrhizobium TaxID=374 RepID=UPI001BA7079D|nr:MULTISPECIES: hypothetical protein [Bradyrhizobium]MBR0828865.1 hypothetical protein [Bradyrhizobium manausense]UVO28126.1 hypothetical protein KUF59_37585 [Bradyrhizobium arachidis]